MYERYRDPLLPRRRFMLRLLLACVMAAVLTGLTLAVGMAGYHLIAGVGWLAALRDAALVLTGNGPITLSAHADAQLFDTCYALFSGMMFVCVGAVLLAPVFHRLLHRFHMDPSPK